MKAMYKAKSNTKSLKRLVELIDSRMNTVSMKIQNKQLDLSVDMVSQLHIYQQANVQASLSAGHSACKSFSKSFCLRSFALLA